MKDDQALQAQGYSINWYFQMNAISKGSATHTVYRG